MDKPIALPLAHARGVINPSYGTSLFPSSRGRGVTPIGAMSRAATAVKMQSNIKALLGDQSNGVLGSQEVWPRFCTCVEVSQLSMGQG